MTYTALSITAVLLAVGVDLVVIRTRLMGTRVFWVSYLVILAFQLVTNGILTGYRIVRYNPTAITGVRVVHAPIEDLAFGFALTLATLIAWTRLGAEQQQPDDLETPSAVRAAAPTDVLDDDRRTDEYRSIRRIDPCRSRPSPSTGWDGLLDLDRVEGGASVRPTRSE